MPNAVERAKVQYFYSLASPWAYLGAQRLIDLCADKGVVIEAFPIATFKDNGWIPLMEKPANRQAYVALDLKRWVSRLGLPMVTQGRPAGMAGLGDALPMIYAAQLAGVDALALAVALQKAYWEECIDVGLPGPRAAVATAAGFDGAAPPSRRFRRRGPIGDGGHPRGRRAARGDVRCGPRGRRLWLAHLCLQR
ncbi:DSBA oxidoreductase [Ketogulonicigenium vulgare Y25]|uniref:DsbA family protein n=1 Tax=Ketogulonicigenium vulgare TaxID=92945 RepID=UPI0001E683ED|nr:DSBA oxidoreductase [Ketogulonicigenium vulgare Y25]